MMDLRGQTPGRRVAVYEPEEGLPRLTGMASGMPPVRGREWRGTQAVRIRGRDSLMTGHCQGKPGRFWKIAEVFSPRHGSGLGELERGRRFLALFTSVEGGKRAARPPARGPGRIGRHVNKREHVKQPMLTEADRHGLPPVGGPLSPSRLSATGFLTGNRSPHCRNETLLAGQPRSRGLSQWRCPARRPAWFSGGCPRGCGNELP